MCLAKVSMPLSKFILLAIALLGIGSTLKGQEFSVLASLECPCELTVEQNTASISYSVQNQFDKRLEDLHITLRILGERDPDADIDHQGGEFTALLDTVRIEEPVRRGETLSDLKTDFDFGEVPPGNYFLEAILHRGSLFDSLSRRNDDLLDTRWFEGQVRLPGSGIALKEVDYLTDSDGDGVADLTEKEEGTDPADSEDRPPTPVVDVLSLYFKEALLAGEIGVAGRLQHYNEVVNHIFQDSGVDIEFRLVGIEEVTSDDFRNEAEEILPPMRATVRNRLLDDYRPDVLMVYRETGFDSLCGVAEEIGGLGNRGFMDPYEHAIYATVYHHIVTCTLTTVAHEIGHLLGLGHSPRQGSIGTYHFSRGHGVGREFGTLMTYEGFYRGIEIDSFSNPDRDCLNRRCGVDSNRLYKQGAADAVKSLNATRYQVANRHEPNPEFDADGDGVPATLDAFPLNPNESADSDGDGFGDNIDQFDSDPLEWSDTDGDGIGDNSDPDIDNDGILNFKDRFPFDENLEQLSSYKITTEMVDDDLGRHLINLGPSEDEGPVQYVMTRAGADLKSEHGNKRSGYVYLFNEKHLAEADVLDEIEDRVVDIDHLATVSGVYSISGSADNQELGTVIATSSNLSVDGEAAFVITAKNRQLYVLFHSALNSMDEADGTIDGQIAIEHCLGLAGCTQVDLDPQLTFHDALVLTDMDGDGLGEIALAGLSYDVPQSDTSDSVFLTYVLASAEVLSVEAQTSESAIDLTAQWGDLAQSFVISEVNPVPEQQDSPFLHEIDLAYAGNVLGGDQEWYLIAFRKVDFNARFVLLFSTEGLANSVLTNQNRQASWSSVRSRNQIFRFTSSNGDLIGSSIGRLGSITDAGREDTYIWSSFTGYAIPGRALADRATQGEFDIDLDSDEFLEQSWVLNRSWHLTPDSRLMLNRDDDERRTFFSGNLEILQVSPFPNYEYVDDPDLLEINRILNLEARLELEGRLNVKLPLVSGVPYSQIPELTNLVGIGIEGTSSDRDIGISFRTILPNETWRSEVHLLRYSDLSALDLADGRDDNVLLIQDAFGDTDGDGIENFEDLDDDGDGVPDRFDQFSLDPNEAFDADNDGVGNNEDLYPVRFEAQFDIDADGIGDHEDEDIDGDGLLNDDDPYPLDTDNDGLTNRQDDDDDNDGVVDLEDIFPLDPSESSDSDGDGYGDNIDALDDDPDEWQDTDLDGIGNNTDDDDDGDGVLDDEDAFPLNPDEQSDRDGDGYGDNSDLFPDDPNEWKDTDGDGIGDNAEVTSLLSYRFIGPVWRDITDVPITSPITTFRSIIQPLGDIQQNGSISFGLFDPTSAPEESPALIVGIEDLSELDLLDSKEDRTVGLENIPMGRTSYRITHTTLQMNGYVVPGAAFTQSEGGGGWVAIGAPTLATQGFLGPRGAVFLIKGSNLNAADMADNTADGIIDLGACVTGSLCIQVHSAALRTGMGSYLGIVENDGTATDIPHLYTATRDGSALGGMAGSGKSSAALYLSGNDIASQIDAGGTYSLSVSDILARPNSFTIHPPDTQPAWPGDTLVSVLKDGVNTQWNIAFSQSYTDMQNVHIAPIRGLEVLDQKDGSSDRAVGLHHVVGEDSTWLIQGASLGENRIATGDSLDSEGPWVFFSGYESSMTSKAGHLLDPSQFGDYDAVDGTSDGTIDIKLSAQFENSLTIEGIEDMVLSAGLDADGERRLVVLGREMDVAYLYLITEDSINKLISSGAIENQRLVFADLNQHVGDGIWQIKLPDLVSQDVSIQTKPIGDVTGDGYTDYVGSFVEARERNLRRTTAFTLVYSDLATADYLDGEQDYRVEFERLWAPQ